VPALAAAIVPRAAVAGPLPLLLLTAVSSLLGSDAARARMLAAIEALGDPAVVPARGTMEMIVDARGSARDRGGVLVMVYFASAVFHELEPPRPDLGVRPRMGLSALLVPRLIALILVPAAVAAGMLLMALSFLHALAAPIVSQLLPSASPVWAQGRTLIPFALMAVLLALLYRYGPRTAVRWGDVRLGAALTALAFSAGNAFLATMLRKNLLASLYGAAGAIVLLLLWIFYSAHILLIGACFTRSRRPAGSRAGVRTKAAWAGDAGRAGAAPRGNIDVSPPRGSLLAHRSPCCSPPAALLLASWAAVTASWSPVARAPMTTAMAIPTAASSPRRGWRPRRDR
jgi:membrane protein